MTNAELKFLELIKNFIKNQPSDLSGFQDWQDLFILADMHSLYPVIFEQVFWTEEFRTLPAVVQEKVRKQAKNVVMLQTMRTSAFLQVYKGLCEAGAKPLVLKGIICRELYPRPDYRMSSDEDLFIRRDDFEICDRYLLSQGFTRSEMDPKEQKAEVSYLNKNTGVYLELHMELFPYGEDKLGKYGNLDREFTDVFEHIKEVEVQGVRLYTMNDTDHLFYLFCHALKHFLHAGFGIRQLCDIMLMAETYQNDIDWNCLKNRVKNLKLQDFFACIVEIGDKYLDIFVEELDNFVRKVKLPDMTEMIEDMLRGGVFGSSTLGRHHSANITMAAAGGRNGLMASLFPDKEYMRQKFPYLQKYPWLYPVASFVRMWQYGKKVLTAKKRGGSCETDSLKIGRQRVKMMKKYGVIE